MGWIRRWELLTPLSHGERTCPTVRQGKTAADGQPRRGGQGVDEGLREGGIAVGRLDHQLRLLVLTRQDLECTDARCARGSVLRQISHKGEALTLQATGCHGKCDGAGARQGHDRNVQRVRGGHDVGSGVGHAGQASFTDEAEWRALLGGGEEGVE